MADDPLTSARAALAGARPEKAIDLAWKAVRPAVVTQQTAVIRETMQFAEEVATQTRGETQRKAEQLAAYCTACILQPQDSILTAWSMKRLFGRGGDPKKKCPDCAEAIQQDARVCRYCGYRYPQAAE